MKTNSLNFACSGGGKKNQYSSISVLYMYSHFKRSLTASISEVIN